MAALYLREDDVAALATPALALQAVEAAHRALAQGEAVDVPRKRVRGGRAMQHVLQASWPQRGVMGYKAYTSGPQGTRFWVHLFDAESGVALAVIEANLLGLLRTSAASALAARELAQPEASVVGLVGAGWQAAGQLRAMAQVRKLQKIKVFARRTDKLKVFCQNMSVELQLSVESAPDAQSAVTDCDIVVTATTAAQPVLLGQWLSPGMHVSAVGSNALLRRELDEAAVERADVLCVDTRDTALLEAGDLWPGLEKGRLQTRSLLELGDILVGKTLGRTHAQQITLFESQGLAIQDLALALAIVELAKENGSGQSLPW